MSQKNNRGERLHILTNSHCNNGCIFCSDVHKQSKLDFKSLRACAENDLRAMQGKVDKVLFSSGEPTLHPNLVDLIRLAKSLGYKEIGLISNGKKFADKKFCEQMVSAGLTEINVSLHGSRQEIHDKITRVPGSFNQTFRGICNLSFLKQKFSFELYVNFLMNKVNFRNIGDFLKLISSFDNLDGVVLNTVLPAGRAEENFQEVIPNFSEVGAELRKTVPEIKQQFSRHSKLYVLGLPPCLISGLESSIINYEPALRRKNLKKKNDEPVGVKWPRKIKGKACAKCDFHKSCSGVWKAYIEKKGWSEFRPVIRNSKKV